MVEANGHRRDSLYGPRTALVVVDVQNDFAHPEGSLSVPGGEGVVDAVNSEVERAAAAGARIVYTQDWHPPDTPHFVTGGGVWPPHGVRGTWGAQLHDRLLVAGEVVRKATGSEDGYSGFTVRHAEGHDVPTRLGVVLMAAGIDTVVIVGLATDYCVRDSATDAVNLGFATVVLRDAIGAVDVEPGDGERALAGLSAAGVTVL